MAEFDQPLRLTTPYMKGFRVRDAQFALQGNNIFKENFHPGKIDNEYGPQTASATYRAKWLLGYTKPACNHSFGQKLFEYLHGKRNLTIVMKLRRRSRLKAHNNTNIRQKALELARTQIGVKESPTNSNRVKYTEWYRLIGPWCAIFITWCFVNSGSKRFIRGSKYSYVPYVYRDAVFGRNGLIKIHDPEPGDLVCYSFPRDYLGHMGIFENWLAPGISFNAIEGNTGINNQSNGGEVMRRQRYVSEVTGFVRVLG